MTYKTENEFALDLIPIIGGSLAPDIYRFYAEVPTRNGHRDLLVMVCDSHKSKVGIEDWVMLLVDFKLKDLNGLHRQIQQDFTGIKTIGIINHAISGGISKYTDSTIFPYTTGSDVECEIIHEHLQEIDNFSPALYYPFSRLYYWGYHDVMSNYGNCGKQYCNRLSLPDLWKRACKNIFNAYGVLSFDVIFPMLNIYAISTEKQYYREAVKEFK